MSQLIFLGTSNAVPDTQHENTHMVLVGEQRMLLIDCVHSPIVRMQQAGLDANDLTDVVLTHFHPDHVSGVPSLLMHTWLLGRSAPLNMYGLAYTLERTEKMMDFYDWASWPNFFPVHFCPVPEQELALVLECADFRVFASPVKHMIPTIGLRIEMPEHNQVLAYSCDTSPCDEVVRLARDATVLIHEATGDTFGHSSAAQAGEIARRAGAKELLLIHYSAGDRNAHLLLDEARQTFDGPVTLAQDFMTLSF